MLTVRLDDGSARQALSGIAHRLRFLEPGLHGMLGPVLDTQRRWWATRGGGTWAPLEEEDLREGDDQRLMFDSGRLHDASTQREHPDQKVGVGGRWGANFVFVIDVPYAAPLARRGRSALAEQSQQDARRYGDQLLEWVLTG